MQIIYEPKGKAREYAPLAANLYTGCPHGCRYCYGPTIPNPAKKGLTMTEWRAKWHECTRPRPNMLAKLDADCRSMLRNGDTRPVMISFACDPYPPDEPEILTHEEGCLDGVMPITRGALDIMREYEVTPIILTKGGTRACRDFDVIKAAGGWFGQTCAWWWFDDTSWKTWEPNASEIRDRCHAFDEANIRDIPTWCSVEPVIDQFQALRWIEVASFGSQYNVKHFKLGKLSGYDAETSAIERSIRWRVYREEARRILNTVGYREITEPGVFEVGTYYVKRELREAL